MSVEACPKARTNDKTMNLSSYSNTPIKESENNQRKKKKMA